MGRPQGKKPGRAWARFDAANTRDRERSSLFLELPFFCLSMRTVQVLALKLFGRSISIDRCER
jgi:hypothetical protein